MSKLLFVIASLLVSTSARAALVEGRLAVGDFHSCAIVAGGKVKCWGLGDKGQLGDGKKKDAPTAIEVANLKSVSYVAAGNGFSCAVHDGNVSCWGCFDMNERTESKPAAIAGIKKATKLWARAELACAIESGGDTKCWSMYAAEKSEGKPLAIPEFKNAKSVAVSGSSTGTPRYGSGCAAVKGAAKCFGKTEDSGFKDMAGAKNVANVFGDSSNFFAVSTAGDVNYWGDIDDSEWGLKSIAKNKNGWNPVAVSELKGAAKIVRGMWFGCVLMQAGTVKCWGQSNGVGRLGDGDKKTTNKSVTSPVNVLGLKDVVDIGSSGSGLASCALQKSGKVKCWGKNFDGNRYGILGADLKDKFTGTPAEVQGVTVTMK